MSKGPVVIDGVTYVPVAVPDEVRFYFMHDNHLFTSLAGNTATDIVDHAVSVQLKADGAYGALCPAIVLAQGKEVRRVGAMVHSASCGEWRPGAGEWIACIEADPDIGRIMAELKRGDRT